MGKSIQKEEPQYWEGSRRAGYLGKTFSKKVFVRDGSMPNICPTMIVIHRWGGYSGEEISSRGINSKRPPFG
jgi:hypothetical protein